MMRRLVIAGALAALALAGSFAPPPALARQQDAASPAAAAPAPAAPAATTAATAATATPATAAGPLAGQSAGNLMQTIFALLFVLGLLAVLAWAMKRYGPKVQGGNANIHLVGALNLGGRERIIVVEVGDQWIVVGASPGRVNALATMPKQEAAATATLHPPQPAASSFGAWLKQTIDKRNAN